MTERSFMHIDPKTMSATERKQVLQSLIFPTEKNVVIIKVRHCFN